MRVELGYGLITCQRCPGGDAPSDRQLHTEALELTREAERLGFEELGPEPPLTDSVCGLGPSLRDDGYLPSVLGDDL